MMASTLGVAYALAGRVAEALPLLEQTLEQWPPARHDGHAGALSLSG